MATVYDELKACVEMGKTRLQLAASQALAVLKKRNFLWTMRLKCTMIGCSEYNRDGQGVDCAHVQDLVSIIATNGWVGVLDLFKYRFCFQMNRNSQTLSRFVFPYTK